MSATPIFLCCTVKNRAGNLKRLCKSLNSMKNAGACRLIVADFASTDADMRVVLRSLKLPSTLVMLDNVPFNRSQGLNYAARYSEAKPGEILFFIDVDMLVPENFPTLLRTKIGRGRAWFPICYSLHRNKPAIVKKNSRKPKLANGWWRDTGKGMCGFICTDFNKTGRWNERIGITWGAEDGEIARRTVANKIVMGRDRCDGLFHVWHPTGGYKTRYHRKINPRQKPVVSKPEISIWKSDR
jgi:hypothetical protein